MGASGNHNPKETPVTLEWLPAAVRDPHGRALAWTTTRNPKGLLHTTEGAGWPDYQGWTILPHATIMPIPGVGVTVRQHVPFTRASFALAHTDPNRPTNTDYVFQFELVGTCDPTGRGMYYWPDADDAVLRDLWAKVIAPLDAAFTIPARSAEWLAYPASYGNSRVRMADSEFESWSGWLGHEHPPQNDHGDPGAFPWARMITLVQGADMPITDAEFLRFDAILKANIPGIADACENRYGVRLPDGTVVNRDVEAATLDGLLRQILAKVSVGGGGGGVDVAALAAALGPILGAAEAADLAKRLAG